MGKFCQCLLAPFALEIRPFYQHLFFKIGRCLHLLTDYITERPLLLQSKKAANDELPTAFFQMGFIGDA